MSEELMTVKELSKYLSLNEKKIYSLIKNGIVPCTKITGKWLFPKKLIDKWLDDSIQYTRTSGRFENITITGSHDLAVELLASEVNEQFPRLNVFSAHIGSLRGLETLQRGRAHIAGVHLLDPETNEYNLPYLQKYAPDLKPIVIHFLNREQGLLVQPGNPLNIRGFEDLCNPQVRLINRQEGAGTRLLLDHHLKRRGIGEHQVKGYSDQVSTHTEVAMAIRNGRANVGLGIRAAAARFGLDFVPVTKERYDFIIPKRHFYTEPIQKFIEVIRSRHFRHRVRQMVGYNVSDAGMVLSWG